MCDNLDLAVYPDLENPPVELATNEERADEFFAGWREAFDRFPLADSPAYGTFRILNGWPPVPGGRIMLADYER